MREEGKEGASCTCTCSSCSNIMELFTTNCNALLSLSLSGTSGTTMQLKPVMTSEWRLGSTGKWPFGFSWPGLWSTSVSLRGYSRQERYVWWLLGRVTDSI